jgi:hypothetical protein
LAQKGIGKEHLDLWQHLLDEVQRLSSRPAIIEECARVLLDTDAFCPSCGHNRDKSSVSSIDMEDGKHECQMCGIQWSESALAPGGQNAAPPNGPSEMGRMIDEKRTVAAPDELRKAYFEGYEDALKDRSAPAEVAEGAPDMELKKLIENAPVGDFGNELRAAPSLSREDWQILSAALAVYAMGDANLTALRSKVREASKSRP